MKHQIRIHAKSDFLIHWPPETIQKFNVASGCSEENCPTPTTSLLIVRLKKHLQITDTLHGKNLPTTPPPLQGSAKQEDEDG